MSDLLALAERCEKATGPDREIDLDIARALGWEPVPNETGAGGLYGRWWRPVGHMTGHVGPPRYTNSLDAAMTLVPGGLGFDLQRYWIGSRPEPAWMCEIASGGVPDNPREVFAADDTWSPALSVTAAALRARASQEAAKDMLREAGRGT